MWHNDSNGAALGLLALTVACLDRRTARSRLQLDYSKPVTGASRGGWCVLAGQTWGCSNHMESSNLLIDLAVALTVAGLGALVATLLRQSTIIGFIVAGVFVGPHTPGISADIVAVEELANIGLVLLMFSIGVHISLSDLRQVGRVATLGASAQILALIGAGVGLGVLFGWGLLEATFFGAVMAISSGAVMSRLLGERGELATAHGRLALGWSGVQDFATIVLVVVLSAMATGEGDIVLEVVRAVGEAAVFLAVLLPVGSRVLPWLLERVAALHNREVFILAIASLALGTAYLSTWFGLSLALGAFVAGVVVSESDLSHQVLGQSEPLRDIFAGLFFISIGMFVDPGFVLRHVPELLLAVTVIVLFKGLVIALLVSVFNFPVRTGVLTGVALSQAGEFSFLLARLGGELEVVSEDVFNLMLAASAVSILLTAPLLASVDPLLRRFKLPLTFRGGDGPDNGEALAALRDHAVLCGYGRVGQVIGRELLRREIPLIVLEEDPMLVRSLQGENAQIVLGYAELPEVLDQARLEKAQVLIVAIPDPLAAQRIIDHARQTNPQLPIVVRAHHREEQARFVERGATEALVSEVELALEMVRFTLERFDVPTTEVLATVLELRRGSRAGTAARALP
jgi:CPA2 family monovalent cation:H+ antiporter-2